MGRQASQARASDLPSSARPGTTTHHLPWAGVKMVSLTIQESVQAGLAALPAPISRVYAFSAGCGVMMLRRTTERS
jgi:hypothetical protein